MYLVSTPTHAITAILKLEKKGKKPTWLHLYPTVALKCKRVNCVRWFQKHLCKVLYAYHSSVEAKSRQRPCEPQSHTCKWVPEVTAIRRASAATVFIPPPNKENHLRTIKTVWKAGQEHALACVLMQTQAQRLSYTICHKLGYSQTQSEHLWCHLGCISGVFVFDVFIFAVVK